MFTGLPPVCPFMLFILCDSPINLSYFENRSASMYRLCLFRWKHHGCQIISLFFSITEQLETWTKCLPSLFKLVLETLIGVPLQLFICWLNLSLKLWSGTFVMWDSTKSLNYFDFSIFMTSFIPLYTLFLLHEEPSY